MKNSSMTAHDVEERPKSKSQIKRELHELQALGKQLVELSPRQLLNMPLSDELREAVIAAKSIKHGALNRQLKYIGGFLRREDAAAIRMALIKLRGK